MSDSDLPADELLTWYAAATEKALRLKESVNHLDDIVTRTVRREAGDDHTSSRILADHQEAIEILGAGREPKRFAALLALTFIWKDESTRFRELVWHTLTGGETERLRSLAATALGNLYADTGDAKAVEVLRTFGDQPDIAPQLKDSVAMAMARVLGKRWNGVSNKLLAKKIREISGSESEYNQRMNALAAYFGTDFFPMNPTQTDC